MSTIGISLERFRELVSRFDSDSLNLFIGAGISRDPPTCGPIWSEMLVGFLDAVFDRMQAEGWPAAFDLSEHREKIRELNVRPELFWREVISITGENVIWKAFGAVGVGSPNENHARVAALLNSGRCKWCITTNFDEYVETFLTDNVRVVIPTDEAELSEFDSSTYVKLHGSIGVGRSLSYTLEHYDSLKRRNACLFKVIIPNRPLVIAGYSGYDPDVLPVLRDLADRVPWIVVIQHPGSSKEQPIFQQLAVKGSQSYILESTCQQALGVLTEGIDDQIPRLKSVLSTCDAASYYSEAVGMVEMHLCPLILLTAFRLSGAWELVHKYAWLTHDAVTDSRDRPSISEQEYRWIHQYIALCLKFAGDSCGAQIMLNEAKISLDESEGNLSDFLHQMVMEAIIKDAPSQLTESAPIRTSMPGFKPSDVIATHLAMAKMFGSPTKKEIFNTCWQIGITRRREGDYNSAIKAFNEAAAIFFDDVVTHLERGRFLLDFGGAVYEHSVELRDDELLGEAYRIFYICDKCTQNSGDWVTNAKANLMLAKIHINSGSFTEAWKRIRLARLAVGKTKDTALSERIEQLARLLQDLQKHFPQRGDAQTGEPYNT